MTVMLTEELAPIPGMGLAERAEDLRVIEQPGIAAALWQRETPADFQGWLDALDPDRLPRTRQIVRPEGVADAARHACDTAGTAEGPHRIRLVEDIAVLADVFSALMAAPYLRLRLDVVTTNSCRKFHRDAVSARLICTYRGEGTQYGTATGAADPAQVFCAPTGMPLVLRGSLWPETPASGLLHRSPPIEGTGATRLVMVLDPIFDPAAG